MNITRTPKEQGQWIDRHSIGCSSVLPLVTVLSQTPKTHVQSP